MSSSFDVLLLAASLLESDAAAETEAAGGVAPPAAKLRLEVAAKLRFLAGR